MKNAIKLFILVAVAMSFAGCTHKALEYQHVKATPTFTAGVATKANGNLWTEDQIGITVVASPASTMAADYQNVGYETTSTGLTATFTAIDLDNEIEFEDSQETVTFTAYAPYVEGTGSTDLPGTDGVFTNNTEEQPTAVDQTALDYLYAGAAYGSESSPIVSFTFDHVMSQLTINFVAGDGVDADAVAAGAYTLAGIIHDGKFDVNYTSAACGTAYVTGITADDAWELDTNWYPTGDADYAASYSAIVFPQTPEDLTISAVVGSLNYSDVDLLSYIDNGELEAGNSYVYTITVTSSELSISGCTINDWKDHGYDITVGGGVDTEGIGTALSPFTVADIYLLSDADALPDYEVYVTGYVAEVGEWNEADGELSYSIADVAAATNSIKPLEDDDETVTLLIDNGYGLGGVEITSAAYLEAGDEVVVYGLLGTTDDGVEVVEGSIIYSLNGVTAEDNPSDEPSGSLAYGTDDGVEVDTDYSTIVTWASGSKAYDYTATVNGSSESYEILKLGTGTVDGSDTCTIPAGSTSFGYYVVAWTGQTDVPYQITIGSDVYTDVCQGNTGFSGSGTSYSLVGVSASDYRLITFASALTEETTVTVETTVTDSDPRAGFFGVKYFPNDGVDDNSGNGGDVTTTGDGTETYPYTAEDVYALYDAGSLPSDEVYVKGIVCELGSFSESYGDMNYYISDDGSNTGNRVEIYNGYGLDGEKMTSANYLHVGDKVVVCGTLTYYSSYSIIEFSSGSKITSLEQTDYCDVSAASITVDSEAGSTTFTVSSNISWTASSDNSDFTISPTSGSSGETTVTVSYTANTGSARTATITVASSTGSQTVTVSQRSANEKTITWATVGSSYQTWASDTHATYGAGYAATQDGMTVGYYKANYGSDLTAPQTDHIRVYKAAELVISVEDATAITSVKLTLNDSSNRHDIEVTSGTTSLDGSTLTWTGSVSVFEANMADGQNRIYGIEVTYE